MLKHWKSLGDLPRPVWIVFASTLVNRSGSMVLSFLVLYLTRERGFSPEQAGFILFLYGAGAIVAGASRGPARRPMGLGAADAGVALPLRARCSSSIPSRARLPALIAATIALAMLTESFRPAAMSFFGESVEPARRKSAFARLPARDQPRHGRSARRSAASSRRSPSATCFSPTARPRSPRGSCWPSRDCRVAPPAPLRRPARRPDDGDAAAPRDGGPRRPALPLLPRERPAGLRRLLPAHLVDAALRRAATSASRHGLSVSSSRSTAC